MSLKKKASSGFVWTFAQQFGDQGIGFIVSLVLARLLLPSEFGLIGMIAVFFSIGKSLVDSGLNQSLVRGQKVDQKDFSTVFYFNLLAGVLLYIAIFFAAPLVSDFYNQPILTNILRLYCLTFIIMGFGAVQSARFTKEMSFKTLTLISVPATVVGGIVGVTMAYTGYGVWSLVWSHIATSLVGVVQIWIYSQWKPSWYFNMRLFKEHFSFGYKIALSGILYRIFNNIYLIVIGKYFSPAQVGFYTRAETMKQMPVSNLSNALNKVTFPLFAKIQDDDARLKRVYSQLMKMVVFVVAPVLIIMAVLAEPLFRFLFTEKWLPAVPYFQILCITGIMKPVQSYNLNVLKVKGRSDLYLKLEVIKRSLTVVAIVIAIQFGIYGLLYAQVLLSFFFFAFNAHYTDKFINYSAWQQIKDVLPILLLSISSGAAVYFLDTLTPRMDDIWRLISGGLIGVISYLTIGYLLKFESLIELFLLIKKKEKK